MSIEVFGTAARRFVAERRGTVAIMSAALLPVLIGCSALAVDFGYLYLDRRVAQGAADLAALSAAADLDRAEAAARATLTVNGVPLTARLAVLKGRYDPDPALAPVNRFKPGVEPFNAVELKLQKPARLFFGRALIGDEVKIGVTALASNAAQATFSVGSRLLALRDGLANALLGALLGGNISLTLMDYNALVGAHVKLQDVLDQLAGEIGVTAGTYDDVLTANATLGEVLNALATVSAKNGQSAASAAVTALKSQAATTALSVPLDQLIDLGTLGAASLGAQHPGLGATLSLMEFLQAAAVLANGENQAAVDLGASIPGVLGVKLEISIGERPQQSPWVAVGEPGAVVRTAQTRLRLVAEIGGTGLLAGARVRLPVAIDVAYAEARLTAIACNAADPSEATATIAAQPGLVDAYIGEMSSDQLGNYSAPPTIALADIVSLPLLKVRGKAHIRVGNTSEELLHFTQADVEAGTIKTVGTNSIARSLVSSLLANLDLQVHVLGLGLGLPGPIKALVAQLLGSVAAPLDALIFQVLQTLGLSVGEADVRVHGIRCGIPALVG